MKRTLALSIDSLRQVFSAHGVDERGRQSISKRLRRASLGRLFVAQLRAVLYRVKDSSSRRGVNRATVALANKMARIAWVLLAHGGAYRAA